MRSVLITLAFVASAYAQLTTVTTLGQTLVESKTLDDNGLTITQTLSTITATTSPTRTAAVTRTNAPQGPVAPPAPISDDPGPAPPTYFWATTTIGGVSTVVENLFTPTFAPAQATVGPPVQGTIMSYSQWATSYLTATGFPVGSGARHIEPRQIASIGAVAIGVVGGALWVFI